MLNDPFLIAMDDGICRLACLCSLTGALCCQSLRWLAVGWTLFCVGMLMLWLAHQFALAPLCLDPTN